MKPWTRLAETVTSDGARLTLQAHDGAFALRVGGRQLMSTTAWHSEARLAELACERLRDARGATVLVGGLGFGFTLARVLDLLPVDARVVVVELIPELVAWNREHLRGVNGARLDDPRVHVVVGDVVAHVADAAPGSIAAMMLDVDNGPAALVDRGNAGLYQDRGLRVVARALAPRGRAVFWSASEDRAFLERLLAVGFRAKAVAERPYPEAKRATHTLFVADRG